MLTNALPPVRFGVRAEKVAYIGGDQKTISVTVRPESAEEAQMYRYSLLDTKPQEPTRWFGGPEHDFGRAFLGSSFKAPDTVKEILDAARAITTLTFDEGALEDTGLSEEDVQHRLLKGLARILCRDAIGFRDRFARWMAEGHDKLTL